MSGPIVRKYGFPNHERIFGKRELEHGAEEQTGRENAEPSIIPGEAPAATEGLTQDRQPPAGNGGGAW